MLTVSPRPPRWSSSWCAWTRPRPALVTPRGILVGGRTGSGHLYVLADLSGPLSQAQWARRVRLAVVTWEASTIVQERNLGMGSAVDDAWSLIRRQAAALREHGSVKAALVALTAAGDGVAANDRQLHKVELLIDAIEARPSVRPARVHTVTPRQSKRVRAEAVTGLYELGCAHHLGWLAVLEFEMTTWQEGRRSPNRLDTLAHLLAFLDASARSQASIGRAPAGTRIPTRSRSPHRLG